MTIKRLITTKAITFPSSCFLSMWTRMERTPFLKDAPKTIRRDRRRSNSATAMREAQQHGKLRRKPALSTRNRDAP
jgi:hypothetical protein